VFRRKRQRGEKPQDHPDVHGDANYRKVHEHVLAALEKSNRSAATLKSMRECGHWPSVVELQNGKICAVIRAQCRVRGCPFCAVLHASRLRQKIAPVVEELEKRGARFSLLSLTIRHNAADNLKDLLNILAAALREFTQSKFFKKHVQGYARSIEITKKCNNGFHPHCHMIVAAGFVDLGALIECWQTCVRKHGGDVEGQGVDIRGLRHLQNGLNEAVGYAFKAAELLEFTHDEINELLRVTKHRHLNQCCRAWGRRAKQLEAQAKEQAELVRAAEGVTRVKFCDLAQDLSHCEPFAVASGLQLVNDLLSKPGHAIGCDWLVRALQVARCIYPSRWHAARAANPGLAVALVESGPTRYRVENPPCLRNRHRNANRRVRIVLSV